MPIPQSQRLKPSGFVIHLFTRGMPEEDDSILKEIPLNWLEKGDLFLEISPKEFKIDIDTPSILKNKTEVSYSYQFIEQEPKIILGNEDVSNILVEDFTVRALLQPKYRNFAIDFYADQVKITIKGFESDGLLSKFLPHSGISASVTINFGFSAKFGFYISGEGFELYFPLHKNLGILSLSELGVNLEQKDDLFALNVFADPLLLLGIGSIHLDRIGFSAGIKTGSPGVLGYSDFHFGLLYPSQAAVQINTEALSGGGFLTRYPEDESYSGGLDLRLQKIAITAFGIISTRLPDGSKNFSMLISLSVTFNPGIPLPFGLTLNGVGGLVGINRRIEVEALKARIKTGAVDSVMFPTNAIANADRIIADLRSIFPPQEGSFVVGPFIRIGWGSPITLIEADIGVFIELPETRIVLLGRLRTILPSPKEPLLVLNIEVYGDLNVQERYLLIFGTLRDSQLLELKLHGNFLFHLSWGNPARFFFSVGGFHEDYEPPGDLPALERLQAVFDYKSGNTSVYFSAELYVAITPNSFQFGIASDLDVYWSKKILGSKHEVHINGQFRFDTLIYFDPFRFYSRMEFSIVARYNRKTLMGVHMNLYFSGPARWRARGDASFKFILKWKVDFDLRWGKRAKKEAPAYIDPTSELIEQLQASKSWSAVFDPHIRPLESLRPIKAAELAQEDILLVHPFGGLSVQQNVVPLDFDLEKVGRAQLVKKGGYRLSVKNTTLISHPLTDDFSRGAYQDLSKAQKLSTKDFERFVAGLELSSQGLEDIPTQAVTFIPETEDIIIHNDLLASHPQQPLPTSAVDVATDLRYSAASAKWRLSRGRGRWMLAKTASEIPELAKEPVRVINRKLQAQTTFSTFADAAVYLEKHEEEQLLIEEEVVLTF